MSSDIFLAIIVYCATGSATIDTCSATKIEPESGTSEEQCLSVLRQVGEMAVEASHGKLYVYGTRCYPLLALENVP